ncbi:Rv0361 family membrane protein [Solirubrobacter soli]|uniref:Rv0361 family membrane protein n=1 Tax=Solirubrobacter soli TaxID=363832 RepID=UPI00041ABB0F|nr:hypothetical protein [Solirubrobacter soli]
MTTAPEPAPDFVQPQAPTPPKRRWGRIILIVAASVIALIVVLIVGLVLLVNSSTKDAQKVSDQLVTAIQAGDGAKAYSLTSPSFQEATTQAQVAELAQRLSKVVTAEKRSPDGKSINASTDTGKIAVFTYTMKGANGKPVYFKTQIRDEDGGWRVLSFQSSEKELNTDVE